MAASMAGSQALKRLELRDAAALFEAHGAEEIRGLERQVRAEIEHKKEELRQMVGERYRDLIEAADTIGQMRCCAEGLLDAVRATDQCCARLRQQSHATTTATATSRPAPARTPQPQQSSQEKFYSMAAQIKLLLEIPEKIWSSMEACQYLHATQLYLLCCHLHNLLRLDSTSGCYSPVLTRFPILVRQVAAASHFRSTILHETKMILRCQTVSDQAVAEALSSVMLLEDSSPRQALTDFLLARKAAIQQLLNQPHHGAGIKAQICSLVELLVTTLYQAHALFYTLPEGVLPDPSLPCGILFSTLDSVTSQQLAGFICLGKGIISVLQDMKLCSWFKHLPASIVEFQPTLRTLAHPINEEYLKDTLQKWINMCHEDIKIGITNLLVYVKSLKGLAGIRDAVWELLTSESISHSWEVVCRRLLDKRISFWEDLLQQLFLDRLQTLTREGFESISNSSKQLLASALQELEASASTSPSKQVQFEHNMSLFLWSESPADLPSDAAWVNVANRSQCVSSGLSMKAQALSPYVQSFCLALDSKLKVKLDDLLSYLPSDATKEAPGMQTKNSAFDRYSDAGTVEGMLRNHCVACTEQIVACVRTELQGALGVLQGSAHSLSRPKLSSVLFMARLCQSLGELCPHLKRCILGKSGSSEKPTREPRSVKKQMKAKAQEVNPVLAKWQEVKEQLMEQSLLGYRLWSTAITNVLVHDFTQSLLLDNAGAILAMATNWDELEIQEETETGSSVTSKIRLPVQPSWYVQSFLFSLCQEINQVGGQALPKATLQEMLKGCLVQVLAGYEKLSEEKLTKKEGTFPMTQNRALQLLYDLRYLSIVLTVKSEEMKSSRSKQDSRIEKVTDFLEGLIDPFDLDVFTPHLNSNLNRLVQRTSVLFGLLTGTDNQFSARSSTVNSQEPHNILPLASSRIRFGLLPLSATSTRKAKPTSRSTEPKDQVVLPTLSRADDDMMRPGSLFRQLVTEEEDTSTPSLFKLSWLSSMTK
ncbi:conserved oligomeric Golgi complex subunit 1 isoform X1 [Dromiciops gliroides]|uniref:conserved oligomeric Golgi complex subunit 1 isoform X1 n=1 Tax=Dromiciops gliroides TaxID=33562 RepID=UPI001CC3C01D|nr:conserved oligomeric Golgi complex subunit 1 isoform X1 [Dromiciops gliroides]